MPPRLTRQKTGFGAEGGAPGKQKPALVVSYGVAGWGGEAILPWEGESEQRRRLRNSHPLAGEMKGWMSQFGPGLGPGLRTWTRVHYGLKVDGLVGTWGLGGW